MVDLQKLVIQTCSEYNGTNTQIAELMGLSLSTFNNRLHMKNGMLFFGIEQLECLQRIVGYPFLADHYAAQFGMLVISNPVQEDMDNVELFSIQMRAEAARGQIAQAKIDAEEDGIVDRHELRHIARQVVSSMKYTAKGFLAWAALHGVQGDAVELMTSRKVESHQVAARGSRCV